MKKRVFTQRLPSASELSDFQTCPFMWLMKWRMGIRKKESGIYLAAGSAVSDAIDEFYTGRLHWEPIEIFRHGMEQFLTNNPGVPVEEYATVSGLYEKVLRLYLDTKKPLWDDWQEVLGAQVWIDLPAKMKLDLLVIDKTDQLVVIEQKVISPFKDIGYENLKYEMGFQPIMYTIGAEEQFQRSCNKVVIDYLVRGAPQRGRYKAIEPLLDTHEMYVEDWKKDLWVSSAEKMNQWMGEIDTTNEAAGELRMEEIPRFTNNCLQKFGAQTYPCEYYTACSVNMNPMEVEGLFKQEEES